MYPFKDYHLKTFKPSKLFLLIILFLSCPNLCSASGIGNVFYTALRPLKPMYITPVTPPILPTGGKNTLEEIEMMPYVEYPVEHKVHGAVHSASLPPLHPAPLPLVDLPIVSTPAAATAPSPPPPIPVSPPEIQVDSNYVNSPVQKPTAIMNCLIEDFDIISIAVSNRLSNLFEKKAETEILERKEFWRRFLKCHCQLKRDHLFAPKRDHLSQKFLAHSNLTFLILSPITWSGNFNHFSMMS